MNPMMGPIGIELVLTHFCNHQCMHCYDSRSYGISVCLDDWLPKCEHIVKEVSKADVHRVILTGGEPLTVPEILMHFLNEFTNMGLDVSINSNLTLITDSLADYIASFTPIPFILTSLPSVDETECDRITRVQGSYNRICEGIGVCARHGIDVGVNIVASGYSSYDYERILSFLKKHRNVKYLAITPVVPNCYNVDDEAVYLNTSEYVEIEKTLSRIYETCKIDVGSTIPRPVCLTGYDVHTRQYQSMCSAGRLQCVIDYSTGDVYACAHSSKSYGNIYEEPLKDIWDRMGEWRDNTLLAPECVRCPSRTYCGGECRLMKNLNGKKYRLDCSYVVELPQLQCGECDMYKLSDDVSIRDSGSVGTIILKNRGSIFVRKPILDLIELFRMLDSFTIGDLEPHVKTDDHFFMCFKELLRAGVLETIVKNNKSR